MNHDCTSNPRPNVRQPEELPLYALPRCPSESRSYDRGVLIAWVTIGLAGGGIWYLIITTIWP